MGSLEAEHDRHDARATRRERLQSTPHRRRAIQARSHSLPSAARRRYWSLLPGSQSFEGSSWGLSPRAAIRTTPRPSVDSRLEGRWPMHTPSQPDFRAVTRTGS